MLWKCLVHQIAHQPLHASDDHDQGGNGKTVEFRVWKDAQQKRDTTKLHMYWDFELVRRLERKWPDLADDLLTMFKAEQDDWEDGSPEDWAIQSFHYGRTVAYNLGQPAGHDFYRLSLAYETRALAVVKEQLAKGGVRLAMILARALP